MCLREVCQSSLGVKGATNPPWGGGGLIRDRINCSPRFSRFYCRQTVCMSYKGMRVRVFVSPACLCVCNWPSYTRVGNLFCFLLEFILGRVRKELRAPLKPFRISVIRPLSWLCPSRSDRECMSVFVSSAYLCICNWPSYTRLEFVFLYCRL